MINYSSFQFEWLKLTFNAIFGIFPDFGAGVKEFGLSVERCVTPIREGVRLGRIFVPRRKPGMLYLRHAYARELRQGERLSFTTIVVFFFLLFFYFFSCVQAAYNF